MTEDGRGAKFARYYNGFSEWCLDHKAISLGVCLLILGACIACLPLVGTAFFPRDRHSVFTVNVYLPEGTPIRHTAAEAQRIIAQIDSLEGPHIRKYTTFVGAGGPRFWLSIVPEQRADNYAQILVHTTDGEVTSEVVHRLKRSLPVECLARVTIEQLETGPPVGVPVQIRLLGNSIEELRRLAAQTKELLRAIPGTDNVHDDWDPEVLQISLNIDPDRANLTGITNQDVAAIVHTGFSGYSPTLLRERDQLIPITLRLRCDERTRYEDLTNLVAVSSITNDRVPLNQIARFKTELVAPKICRRDHERCLTIKCDTVPGVLPSQIVRAIDQQLQQSQLAWPPDYRYEFGGEKYEQQKGFESLTRALVMSLVAIYLVLVWQFNSVTKPLVVFAAVPFGLAAGMMGLLIFQAPFGFMAFLGVASLAGVIVSHIIILFDYIEDAQERGQPPRRAVIDSALVRLRPVLVTVLVTVLATVGGLIPLALEGGPLWEPMCYVQIVGLLAATLVTKVVVPVLYVLFVEDLKIIRWDSPEVLRQHAGPPPQIESA
ncbi:MAG: efflux RND transporter permease subunit [Pirellulaceae bacterium]